MHRVLLCASLLFLAPLPGCGPAQTPGPQSAGGEKHDLYVLYGKPVPTADDPELFAQQESIPRARVEHPSVVLAILDTVRADHLSACGYSRPTSANLEALVRRGAQLTCRAYAPADWTLPSHASFFTGRTPLEHGAGWASGSGAHEGVVETSGLTIHPLGPELPTLAEQMAQRGFQTILVSANRLLTGATGLSRGFQRAVAPPESPDPRRPWVQALLERELRSYIDPSKPLFLVLNFLDAHDPWLSPPDALDWPDRIQQSVPPARFAEYFSAYPNGKLEPQAVEPFRRQLVDLYDYGVLRADAQLGGTLRMLEEAGWLTHGSRVIVTADHGENLAEHGLVRHSLVYESNVRVPLLYWQIGGPGTPVLPEPISAIAVYSLALDGELPRSLPNLQSVSVPSRSHFRTLESSSPAVAAWKGSEKLMLSGGAWRRFDLARDPDEVDPLPVPESDPERRVLSRLLADMEASDPARAVADDRLVEELKSLGYVQ